LAFETEIDLAGSQEKFLDCWVHLHTARGAEPSAQTSTLPPDPAAPLDPREALAAFDEEREAGVDAQTAISRLSARLGVEPDAEVDTGPKEGALGLAIVPALLSEYLWEVEQAKGGGAVARLAVLHRAFDDLQDVEVIEELSPRRLLLLGCTFASEATDLTHEQRVDTARAIGEFCGWCTEQHGLEANPVISGAFESLPDSIERISEANDALAADEAGGVWQRAQTVDGVLSVLGPGEVGHSLIAPETSLACLREDDFVRGVFSEAQFSVHWCYPPELGAAH
jgi:hypothetical protein